MTNGGVSPNSLAAIMYFPAKAMTQMITWSFAAVLEASELFCIDGTNVIRPYASQTTSKGDMSDRTTECL